MKHARRHPRRRAPHRSGLSLIELIASAVLFGAVIVSLGPALMWVRSERRRADDRQLATLELANLAERLSLRPWEDLTNESLAATPLSEAARAGLRHPRLDVRVEEEPPRSRRIVLELTWQDEAERELSPVRLVCWRTAGGADD